MSPAVNYKVYFFFIFQKVDKHKYVVDSKKIDYIGHLLWDEKVVKESID